MGLEAATFISGLNASNPVNVTDMVSQGDDHIRLIKATMLNTFPNITGAMNASHTELNHLVGITGKTGTGNIALSGSPTFTGTLNAAAIAASGAITAGGTITGNLFSGSGASINNISPVTGIAAGALAAGVTVNNGNWSGNLALTNGGTGASTAEGARTNLNASANNHTHPAADITSGTLAVARGGTGQTTMDNLSEQVTLQWTIASDPGGTPAGSPGDVFAYY